MKLKMLNFSFFFKKRLGKDFLHDSPWCVYWWTLQKCKKPHSNVILVSNIMWDSSDQIKWGSTLGETIEKHETFNDNWLLHGLDSCLSLFQCTWIELTWLFSGQNHWNCFNWTLMTFYTLKTTTTQKQQIKDRVWWAVSIALLNLVMLVKSIPCTCFSPKK